LYGGGPLSAIQKDDLDQQCSSKSSFFWTAEGYNKADIHMPEPLHLLLVEDNDDDAVLLLRELRRAGFDVLMQRVQTPEAFHHELFRQEWDAIISDYNLPRFNAPQALEILKKSGKEIPFIVVSGAIGEETAVVIMRAGAHDYFVKGKLNRLAEALRREIRDARERQARQQAEIALRQSEEQLRLLFELSSDAIFIVDRHTGQYLNANKAAEKLTGRSIEALLKLSSIDIAPQGAEVRLQQVAELDQPSSLGKIQYIQPDGSIRIAELSILPINADRIFGIAHDITEQLKTETALRNRAQEVEALYHTSLKINAQVDLLPLLQTIVEQAASLVNTASGGLYLLRPDGQSLELVIAYNIPNTLVGVTIKLGEGLSGKIAQSGETMMVSDYRAWTGQAGIYKDSVFRRVLGAPMRVKGHVTGVINVTDTEKTGSFTPDEIRLVSMFADQAAIAVENARLLDNLQHELSERKQAEQSLRSTQSFLDHVLEAVPLGISVFNLETGQLEFDNNLNRPTHGLHADPFKALLEHDDSFDVHPEDRAKRAEFSQNLVSLADGEVRSIEFRIKTSAQSWAWYRYRYFAFERSTNGSLKKLLIVTEDVTEKKNAEQELQHQLRELTLLHEITRAGIQANTSEELISFVTQAASSSLNLKNFGFLLLDETKEFLIPHPSYRGVEKVVPQKLTLESCLCGQVVLTGAPLRIGNVHGLKNYFEVMDGINSELGVPIIAGENILGVINTESPALDFYTEADERLLVTIAGQIATALERIRLFELERKRRQEAETLRQATAVLSTSLDLDHVLELMLQSLRQVVPFDRAAVLLLEGDHLRTRVGEGFEDFESLAEQIFPADDFIFQEIVRSGKPLILSDAFTDQRFHNWANVTDTRGWMGVPLIWREKVLGYITLSSVKVGAYSSEAAALAQAFAHQSAVAIENARLFEGLEDSLMDLNQAYESTIEGWSRAMDLRDKETEGHTLRVTKITTLLAEAMGITGKDLIHIRYGALLHDIGKLGVPDRILLKPDSLTADEWVIMRRHPQYAYEMLSAVKYLRPSLDIPYRHHERWDGSGYPSGLKGEEIPLAARLFAVVDVWDALTSDRPYRPAWSNLETLAYIKAAAGKQFDPYVVQKFLQVIGHAG